MGKNSRSYLLLSVGVPGGSWMRRLVLVVTICLCGLVQICASQETPSSAKSVLAGLPSKSDKRIVSSSDFPKPIGPYSEAVVAGGFVFVSGQGPFNTKTQKMELG